VKDLAHAEGEVASGFEGLSCCDVINAATEFMVSTEAALKAFRVVAEFTVSTG
jgi:hypothetical protein